MKNVNELSYELSMDEFVNEFYKLVKKGGTVIWEVSSPSGIHSSRGSIVRFGKKTMNILWESGEETRIWYGHYFYNNNRESLRIQN